RSGGGNPSDTHRVHSDRRDPSRISKAGSLGYQDRRRCRTPGISAAPGIRGPPSPIHKTSIEIAGAATVMIRVHTASRLHFGLLNLGLVKTWSDLDGQSVIPARHFGGVGLMVEEPGLQLEVQLSNEWSATGPLSGLALDYARRFVDAL